MSPPSEAGVDKEGRIKEVMLTLAPQRDEATSEVADIAPVDPEVEKVAGQRVKAKPQWEEFPRDDPPLERSSEVI